MRWYLLARDGLQLHHKIKRLLYRQEKLN